MNSSNRLTLRIGFTLIELLISIAVVAILAVIAFPMITRSRDSALFVKNVTNIRALGMACHTYASENGGRIPLTVLDTGGYRSTQGNGMWPHSGPFRLLGDTFKLDYGKPEGGGYANVLFLDGHVEPVAPEAVPARTNTWFWRGVGR